MIRKVLAAALALTATTTPAAAQERVYASMPSSGEEIFVPAGEIMLRTGMATRSEGVVFASANVIGALVLQAGFYPSVRELEDGTIHDIGGVVLDEPIAYLRKDKGWSGDGRLPVAFKTSAEKQQTCARNGGFFFNWCDHEVPYERTEQVYFSDMRQERILTFERQDGGMLYFGYREMGLDPINPISFQRFTHDLAESDLVAFEGARILVLETEEDGIIYEVLAGFGEAIDEAETQAARFAAGSEAQAAEEERLAAAAEGPEADVAKQAEDAPASEVSEAM